MNKNIKQLHEYINIFINANCLDIEFETLADNEEIITIEDLNAAISDELSYWPNDCDSTETGGSGNEY